MEHGAEVTPLYGGRSRLEGFPAPRRRRGLRAVPLRVILPNLVTLLALCLGLTAIRFGVDGQFETAIVAVIAAAVLDGLDGRLARVLRGTSRFGAELDSLADFVDFGVAPALILYLWGLHEIKSFGWFAALVFAIAAALRLARFNVMLDDPNRPLWQSHFFTGMPAPFNIGYVLLIALLMVSPLPHFSGKKIGRIPREFVLPVLFGIAACLLLLAIFTMEMLIGLTLVYLGTIPFAMRNYKAHLAEDAARHAAKGAAQAAQATERK